MNKSLEKALIKCLVFSKELHSGQTRKYTGEPYFEGHILPVVNGITEKNVFDYVSDFSIPYVKIIASFHDALEDGKISIKDLRNWLMQVLDDEVMVNVIMHVILLLTKSKEFNLFDYLSKIKENQWARIVKLADLRHNMSDLKERDPHKWSVYKFQEYFLTN